MLIIGYCKTYDVVKSHVIIDVSYPGSFSNTGTVMLIILNLHLVIFSRKIQV